MALIKPRPPNPSREDNVINRELIQVLQLEVQFKPSLKEAQIGWKSSCSSKHEDLAVFTPLIGVQLQFRRQTFV